MRLSKITETKKGRMALFGEADEFLFSVDAETYYKYGLREGCELDAAALAGLQAASETRRAKVRRWATLPAQLWLAGAVRKAVHEV